MKRLDDRKIKILKDREDGLSLRNLAIKYETSVNAVISHLRKWIREESKT